MQISQRGINEIKKSEELRLDSYQDEAGVWTIGYGHTGPGVGPGQTITESEADTKLAGDIKKFETGVDKKLTRGTLQNEFDAFVSLAFNIGQRAFNDSTAAREFNAGNKQAAADGIELFNKITVNGNLVRSQGLANRRAKERDLFEQLPALPKRKPNPTAKNLLGLDTASGALNAQ